MNEIMLFSSALGLILVCGVLIVHRLRIRDLEESMSNLKHNYIDMVQKSIEVGVAKEIVRQRESGL